MSGESKSGAFTDLVELKSPKLMISHQQLHDKQPVYPTRAQVEEFLKGQHNARGSKDYIRSNHWPIDHEARKFLWCGICRHLFTRKQATNIYVETVVEIFGQGQGAIDDVLLPSFVSASSMISHYLSPAGIDAAKRVVIVIGHVSPDITFGPTIFSLVALFLHYMSEQDCFECIYNILHSEYKYVPQTRIAYEATKYILKDLAKKYVKGWCNILLKAGIPIENVLNDWFWWIFRDLPFLYLVRIVDCYLVEGPKILYRVALAILLLHHKRYSSGKEGSLTTAEAIASSIQQFCSDIPITVEKLLQTACNIRGLSRSEIRTITVRNEMYVASLQRTGPIISNSNQMKVSRSFSDPTGLVENRAKNFSDQVAFRLRGLSKSKVHKLALKSIEIVRKQTQYEEKPAFISTQNYIFSEPFPSERIVSLEQVSEAGDVSHYPLLHSHILTASCSRVLMSWLPARIALNKPRLLFTTLDHGNSITTFFHMVDGKGPTVIIIKSVTNAIFGAYCSADWEERKIDSSKYFGTGETFVFTLEPEKKRYEWIGRKGTDKPGVSNLFMFGDNSRLCIGGGKGIAINLTSDLAKGRSERCLTFENELLVSGEDFECAVLEVYGFS